MIHLITQCVLYLTKGVFEFAFFSYPTTKALSGVLGDMKVGILASHILLSQRPNHKEMQVIHFGRDM
jgi:hypothetical protein